MKADATLVNAGFALGRSYGPADYSSIFEKGYEGLIAAEQAKYKMYGDFATSIGGAVGDLAKGYGKMKGYRKIQREIDTSYPYPGFQRTTGQPGEVIEGQPGEVIEGDSVDTITGQQERDNTRRASGIDKQQRIFDNLQKRIDAGRTLTEKEQADYNEAVTYLETTAQEGSLEGMLNAQGNMIVKDGEWVEHTPTSDVAAQYTSGAMTAFSSHLEGGGTYNDQQWNLVQDHFEDLKAQMEEADKGIFPNKKKRNQLKLQAEAWRKMTNKRASNIDVISKLYRDKEVDLKSSFENDYTSRSGDEHLGPDLNVLAAQVFDPTATKSDQFELFVENGQVMIRYAQGRMGIQYNKSKNTSGKKTPKSEWKTISEAELFGQIVTKDKETPLLANDEMIKIMESAENMVGETDNPEIDSFDDIEEKSLKKYKEVFGRNEANLRYIATNDHEIGNSVVNFSKDYLKNYELDDVINNTFGLGSNKKLDFNGDGKINSQDMTDAEAKGELDKHEAAKAAFMKRLTNPQTQEEKDLLVGELADYWNKHTKNAFNTRRKKMGLPTGDDVVAEGPITTDFKFAGGKIPISKKNPTGLSISSSDQRRIWTEVANKTPTIQGSDDYFYALTPDKSQYIQWSSEQEYDTYNRIVKKNIKDGLTGGDQYTKGMPKGIFAQEASFDDVLKFNGSGTGISIVGAMSKNSGGAADNL